MRLRGLTLTAMSLLFVSFGCGHSVHKAEVSSNTSEEIVKLESEIETARKNHLDVMAPKDYKSAEAALKEAKEEMADGDGEEARNEIGYARGYLQRAEEFATGKRPIVEGILAARNMAITAGARQHPHHNKELGNIDDSFRREFSDLKNLTSADFSSLQTRYMALEVETLKTVHLSNARNQVQTARNEDRAKAHAPNTLRQAELDLTSAENTIAAQRGKPGLYMPAVEKANVSAQFLVDVLNAAHSSENTLDESAAIAMVNQQRKIAVLNSQLGDKDAAINAKARTIAEKERALEEKNQTLQQKDRQLATAGASIAIQAAMETARKQFNEDEAEVYQQGDKLLIRLKAMNFPSGKADLPTSALPLLAKVKNVAQELEPKNIVVEGHTDSLGSAPANQKLSQKRAASVESYLENNGLENTNLKSVGYGFQKPIATNKTLAGRAQNRRVDVIITPRTSTEDAETTRQ
ncbi:MAG: OmpA family protein [Bdellovibrionales bacterium]